MTDFEQRYVTARKAVIARDLARLNPMQRQGAMTTEGPLLLLAGAGSGKTTVLIQRVYNLLTYGRGSDSDEVPDWATEEDLDFLEHFPDRPDGDEVRRVHRLCAVDAPRPWEIIAITFTNKAAGELKERLAARLGPAANDVWASTFHSACVRILRRDIDRIGFDKDFTIYDTDDAKRVIKDILKEQNLDEKTFPIRSVLSAISASKDRYEGPEVFRKKAEAANDWKNTRIAKIYAAYQQKLSTANALDFDDIIYHTVTLLQKEPEVLDYYQKKFRYVLVDEYQDTNHLQYLLTGLLAGGHRNLCVVGDDDQSIYRFRGANIENILNFEKQYKDARVIRLEQNYRSTSNILNAANCVIKNNMGRKGKTLWTENGNGEKLMCYEADSEFDEAAHVAAVIGQNVKKGAKLRDHAILYRMNAQSGPIETYFARAGIPYKIVGGQRFYDRKEIKDMLAYMSIVANEQDDLRLRRIINEPARKIGATTVQNVADIAAGLGVSMLEVIEDAPDYPALARASAALGGFWRIYRRLKEAYDTLPLDVFVSEILEITGYRSMLEAEGEEGQTRMENIGQLVSSVKTYADQRGPEASLPGFLEEVALISDIDSYDEGADVVVLMTMHAAKGLEFNYVFIVGLEEGIFPSEMSRYSNEDLEEERRLCYVGITRAKKELYLSCANSRMLFGQTKHNRPSRFLEEIDASLVEVEQSPAAAQTKAMRQRYMQQQNAYLQPEYGAASMRSTVQAGYSARYGGASHGSGAGGASRPARQRASVGGGFSTVQAGSTASVPRTEGSGAYRPGDLVEHKVFGRGEVLKVTPVAGDTIVEIRFDTAGVKKTMANYAPLKHISE